MSQTALLTSILLALSVTSNPIVVRDSLVSLSFARHLNITGSNDLVLRDRARAKHLVSLSNAKLSDKLSTDAIIGLDVINAAATYQTSVDIGSPANSCELQRLIFIGLTIDFAKLSFRHAYYRHWECQYMGGSWKILC
jgi:cathepsin E